MIRPDHNYKTDPYSATDLTKFWKNILPGNSQDRYFLDVVTSSAKYEGHIWLDPVLCSPCGESARDVIGRQCPHTGVGEDFLTRRPGFYIFSFIFFTMKLDSLSNVIFFSGTANMGHNWLKQWSKYKVVTILHIFVQFSFWAHSALIIGWAAMVVIVSKILIFMLFQTMIVVDTLVFNLG